MWVVPENLCCSRACTPVVPVSCATAPRGAASQHFHPPITNLPAPRRQEALYEEDMGTKVSATASIARLFREGAHFEELQAHPTLLQVGPGRVACSQAGSRQAPQCKLALKC